MAFIGLTERWAESVCLFHRQLHSAPTKQLPWAVEFSDTRPTRSTAEEIDWAVESKRCGVEPYLFTDSRDTALYQGATAKFAAALQEYADDDFASCLSRVPEKPDRLLDYNFA